MILKRPRCENCNSKIFPKTNYWGGNLNYLIGDIPSYCPNCGHEISNAKRIRVEKHNDTICLIICCFGIAFFISVFTIIRFVLF